MGDGVPHFCGFAQANYTNLSTHIGGYNISTIDTEMRGYIFMTPDMQSAMTQDVRPDKTAGSALIKIHQVMGHPMCIL